MKCDYEFKIIGVQAPTHLICVRVCFIFLSIFEKCGGGSEFLIINSKVVEGDRIGGWKSGYY
jgi:hypothetical protein